MNEDNKSSRMRTYSVLSQPQSGFLYYEYNGLVLVDGRGSCMRVFTVVYMSIVGIFILNNCMRHLGAYQLSMKKQDWASPGRLS